MKNLLFLIAIIAIASCSKPLYCKKEMRCVYSAADRYVFTDNSGAFYEIDNNVPGIKNGDKVSVKFNKTLITDYKKK